MILMVAMTSWASACDLSCSLQQFHSLCKLGTTAAGEQAGASPSSDMAMDANMDMSGESSLIAELGSENGPVHLHANSCTHNPCNETSVSATAKSGTERPQVHALQLFAFQTPPGAAIRSEVTPAAPERASPKLRLFDPLSITLRI
jgi:hypothetical protein